MTREVYEEMLKSFDYKEGKLYWKESRGGMKVGDEAGCFDDRGYRVIGFNGKLYRTHRVVFYMHHKILPKDIDHINGKKHDNRIENLRAASRCENSRNSILRTNNVSGVKGVCWEKEKKVWRAQLVLNGKRVFSKRFKTLDEAKIEIRKARQKFHGEYANHG